MDNNESAGLAFYVSACLGIYVFTSLLLNFTRVK